MIHTLPRFFSGDVNSVRFRFSPATVVLNGLEPNTTYEIRVAAVNGKGQGEFSHTESFQTLPIRKSDTLYTHTHTHTARFNDTFFKIRARQLVKI